jgi:hypothetical protein
MDLPQTTVLRGELCEVLERSVAGNAVPEN